MNEREMFKSLDDLLSPERQNESRAVATTPCYSLEGLNLKSSIPLEKIVNAVKMFREGGRCPDVDRPRLTILLSGVPGGGKTAFVRHLADEVHAPLRSYRVSDLLSRWIGESEKRLARAFKTAKEENAILFLDEVDSFLQDRSHAIHTWEVSGVNQLLQEMEDFGGVMIAATNFTDNLDRAAMRRFTFKIELDYLTNEGKKIFFDRYFRTSLTDDESRRLDAIDNLAPGDFRTVKEELFYVCDHETNAERLAALETESRAKIRRRPKMGFL